MEKFDWSHTLSAPTNYPMRIFKGVIQGLPGEYSAYFGLWGVANEGWGRESGMVVVGPDRKAVPDRLKITWLSLRENKYYKGDFKLPRERMLDLFKEGFYLYDIKKHETYTDIVVGLAPGGVIVVWLLGNQTETEVARFQAEETVVDSSMTDQNNEDMLEEDYVDFVLTNRKIPKNPIPFGLWDTYREKYTWRQKLELPKGGEVLKTWTTYFNGEKEHRFIQDSTYSEFKKRALPMEMIYMWKNENGKKYYADLFFDEKEIFEAFKQIYRNDKEQEAELVFTLNEEQNALIIYLRSKTEEIELEKVRNRAYPSTD